MCIKQRWVFAVMGFFALFNAYSMRTCLSISITEMVAPTNNTGMEFIDDTCSNLPNLHVNNSRKGGIHEWNEHTQGVILSSFYWGYIVTHLPGALLAEKFGGKHTLGFGIFSTALLTLLVPFAVRSGGSNALIIVRIIMGLGQGVVLPALNVMTAHWAPPQELSLITAIIFIGVDLGIIISTTISGLILQYSAIGWPAVFYVFGGIGVLWFLLWCVLIYSTPDVHPFITKEESKYLQESLSRHINKQPGPVPWKHIFTSAPFWALLAVQIGHDWGLYTLISDLPKYMSSVLRFSVEYNGYLSSLPNLISCFYCVVISWITDKLITSKYLTKTSARKINTSISTIGPAVFLIAASFAGCDRTVVVICFILGVTLMGSSLPGIKVNSLDLSPNYAGTIMALTNGVAAFTGILTPYIVGVLTPNQTLSEWRLVFWIVFVIFIVTNTVFVLFASGEVQDWNDVSALKEKKITVITNTDVKK